MSDQDSNPKQTGPSSPNWVCAEAAFFAPNGEGDTFSNGDWMIYPGNGESGPVAVVSTKERMELIVEAVNSRAALAEENALLRKALLELKNASSEYRKSVNDRLNAQFAFRSEDSEENSRLYQLSIDGLRYTENDLAHYMGLAKLAGEQK